jgi:hypothetical protein
MRGYRDWPRLVVDLEVNDGLRLTWVPVAIQFERSKEGVADVSGAMSAPPILVVGSTHGISLLGGEGECSDGRPEHARVVVVFL